MLSKILEALYTKVFINIIVGDTTSIVYVEVVPKGEVTSSYSQSFSTNVLDTEMHDYLKTAMSQSPYHYITILDKSLHQGAVPTCNETKNYVDISTLNSICIDKKWTAYTAQDDIKDLKYEYQSVGLDFIFSPFIILSKFFKDKINSSLSIFALVEEKNISLSIFDNGTFLYAEYLHTQTDDLDDSLMMDTIIDDEEISLDIDDSIDLDDIDADDDIGSLDDFGDIEDLDSDVDIEEFSEAKDIEEIVEEKEVSIDDFNDDYNKFIMIQNAINNFYHDEKYESSFVESIYIADSIGVSEDLKKYLEEEMFLNVRVRKISLEEELSEMARLEIL